MNNNSRIILHIDMNCFYCSCEIAENEELANLPVCVAHKDILDRGIILSPSYEARKYGIHAPMKVSEAKKLYPKIIVVEPNFELYNYYSNCFYKYLLSIHKDIIVEMASCDEAYVDISKFIFGKEAVDLAYKIQNDLKELYNLPCSIGIAPNKYLAKMASDMKKPMGITILARRDVQTKMWPLPIDDLFGIGKKTSARLHQYGINKIGDFAKEENKEIIIREFGKNFYEGFLQRVYGIENSPVNGDYEPASSFSASHTYMEDIANINIIYQTIQVLINSICNRLQNNKKLAVNIGIQIRYNDYQTINRSKTLIEPSNDEYILNRFARDVFNEFYEENRSIRLIGVFTNRLKDENEIIKQISIFDDFDKLEKEQKINTFVKEVNKLTGANLVKKGM